MATFQGSANGVNSATMPTHQSGDLILIFAFEDGGSLTPTLASGYTNIDSNQADNSSFRLGYKIATSSSETTGTWTNAEALLVHVYRPGAGETLSIGSTPAKNSSGFASTVNFPSLTMDVTDGTSWVVGFAGHASNNTTMDTPPAGMTNRSYQSDAICRAGGHDTNGGVTSWTSTNVSVGGSSASYKSSVVEIVVTATGPSITSITDPITTGGTATITGVFTGATLGNTSVTQNAVALTVNSVSDTTIEVVTVDIESSALKYGNHTFEVTVT